jgi:hypothetical protein
MKKYLLVFANYSDWRQQFFLENMSPRNKQYCLNHGTEYLEILSPVEKWRGHFTWQKFKLVLDKINSGDFKEGDIITHIDADMCIVRPEIPYETSKSFSYSIDSGNTHCMGSYSLKVNEWSINLLKNILSEDRFNLLNDKVSVHERFGFFNSFWHDFREQASWYSLAGIKRHSDIPFWNMPHFGWHSNLNEHTLYSLENLYTNVEVLPTFWNVTEVKGESSGEFLINEVRNQDVIIRHFAGGQPWRKEWFV